MNEQLGKTNYEDTEIDFDSEVYAFDLEGLRAHFAGEIGRSALGDVEVNQDG